MTRDEVWQALAAAIREEVGASDLALEPGMTAADVPGWDFLAHVRIVLNVEDRTGAAIRIKDTYGAATIGELWDIVVRQAPDTGAG